MKNINFRYLSPVICLLTSACMPSLDMHGIDPRAYYAEHPIENKLETQHLVYFTEFDRNAEILSANQLTALKKELDPVAPKSIKTINLQVLSSDAHKTARIKFLRKTLHSLGYNTPINIDSAENITTNEVVLDIVYTGITPPDCPDWKKSSVTTYSNTEAANFGCATTVDFGLMIDDPNDLVIGKGNPNSNTESSTKALSDYRSGKAATPSAAPASASTGSSGASATGQ